MEVCCPYCHRDFGITWLGNADHYQMVYICYVSM